MNGNRPPVWVGLAVLMIQTCMTGTVAAAVTRYTVHGYARCAQSALVPCGDATEVEMYDVDPLSGNNNGYRRDSNPLQTAVLDSTGYFIMEFDFDPDKEKTGDAEEKYGPDVVFTFYQDFEGVRTPIYDEGVEKTRWGIAVVDTFYFEIESAEVVCCELGENPGDAPEPRPGNSFAFSGIGRYPVRCVDCNPDSLWDSDHPGYCCPGGSEALAVCAACLDTLDTNMPFGGNHVNLSGWFEDNCQFVCYKVQFRAADGSGWRDITTPLWKSWFRKGDEETGERSQFVPERLGPFLEADLPLPGNLVGDESNLYVRETSLKPNEYWYPRDHVMRFDTTIAPDGPCSLRVVPYKSESTPEGYKLEQAEAPDVVIDERYGRLVLQVDNSYPLVSVLDVEITGKAFEPCSTAVLGHGDGDRLCVGLRVWDPRGHLRSYHLEALHGRNGVVPDSCKLRPPETRMGYRYENSVLWEGTQRTVEYFLGGTCWIDAMPSCAYQLRLSAWKRTTDGSRLLRGPTVGTWHMQIERQ